MKYRQNLKETLVVVFIIVSTMSNVANADARRCRELLSGLAVNAVLGTGALSLAASPFLLIYGGVKFVQSVGESSEAYERAVAAEQEAELAARPIDKSEGLFPLELRGRWKGYYNEYYIASYRTNSGQNIGPTGINPGQHFFFTTFEMEIRANEVTLRRRIYRDRQGQSAVTDFTPTGFGPSEDSTLVVKELWTIKEFQTEVTYFVAGLEKYRIWESQKGKPPVLEKFYEKTGWRYVGELQR